MRQVFLLFGKCVRAKNQRALWLFRQPRLGGKRIVNWFVTDLRGAPEPVILK
jgi:hypothetical protein